MADKLGKQPVIKKLSDMSKPIEEYESRHTSLDKARNDVTESLRETDQGRKSVKVTEQESKTSKSPERSISKSSFKVNKEDTITKLDQKLHKNYNEGQPQQT